MELVLVHLGSAKADHLPINIAHLRKTFPHNPVTLILTDDADIRLRNIKGVKFYFYERTFEIESVLKNLNHNHLFRKGFWIFSLERIFALAQWSRKAEIGNFLHIESDVLLLPNFPIAKVNQSDNLLWTRFNGLRDVGTFLYSPNQKEIDWVESEIIKLVNIRPETTDMTSLSYLSNSFPNRVKILPSTPDEKNNEYGGIFDPAPYGMWLTGQDPRNNWGLIRRFIALGDSMAKPEKFKYELSSTGELFIQDESGSFSLFNLHLHSKRKHLFGKYWKPFLRIDVWTANKRILRNIFSFSAFIQIFQEISSRHKSFRGKLSLIKHLIGVKAN